MGIIGSFVASLASATPTAASSLERSQTVVLDLMLGRGFNPTSAETATPVSPPPTVAIAAGDFQDLTLPADILAIVEPVLAQFDIRVEVTRKEHQVLKSCSMHVATDGSFKLYLLHFDSKVLEDPLQGKDVLTIGFLFGRGETLKILSRGCDDPDPAFDFTWDVWKKQDIAAKYIGWRDIERLKKLEVDKRPDFLRIKFDLPDTVKRRGGASPARLLDDAVYFKGLVDLIAANGNATAPGVDAFINNHLIGVLPEKLQQERSEWGSSYGMAARSLLQWTESKGNHPSRKGYTCTGAVLETFLDGQAKEGRELIIKAFERFRLITDDKELSALKKKYLDEANL